MQTARGRTLESLRAWAQALGRVPHPARVRTRECGASLRGLGFSGLLEPVGARHHPRLAVRQDPRSNAGIFAAKVLNISKPPEGASWLQLLGVAHLCGIGFTMSLLVAVLAYETQAPHLFDEAKLGVLVGSTLGAIAGIVVLLLAPRPRAVAANATRVISVSKIETAWPMIQTRVDLAVLELQLYVHAPRPMQVMALLRR